MKIVALMLAFGLCLPVTWACRKQRVEGEIKGYEYARHGMRSDPEEYYKLERNAEGTLILKYTHYERILKVIKAPDDALSVIDGYVRSARMWNIKEMYPNPPYVKDGHMWNLKITYEQGSIYSSGSNNQPSAKIQGAIEAINAYLHGLTDNVTEADIIEYVPYE